MKMWYHDSDGDVSTMRIVTMMAAIVGCIAVLSGSVALFLGIPEGVALAGIGGGMTGLGEIAKAWQAQKGA